MSCAAAIPLTGCTETMTDKPLPEYRENPSPRQAYRLAMTIKDAPGPLKIMVGAAQYDVINTDCLPPPKENPGGRSSPVPTNDIPFVLTQVSEGQYTGIVYADGMIDEDYHGRGVCRWGLVQAQVQLKATGAEAETKFIASLSQHQGDFRSGQPKTIYYWKGGYPRAEQSKLDNFPDFGNPDLSRVAEAERNQFFSITLVAEDMAP